MQLPGRAVVVTGAGDGIGAATVRALSARGALVVGVDRNAGKLHRVLDPIGGTGVVADVRDPSHAERAVAAALDAYGRLDAVVANAGVGHAGDFVAMPVARIDELLEVDVRAPMLLARAAAPVMLAQGGGGALVLVSSIAGALAVPGESVYSAAKAAVDAFAESLREELLPAVTVSTVVPAVVATRFFERRGEPYTRRFPRPQRPERLAAAIVDAIERGRPRVIVPRWFAVPVRLHGAAPRLYRGLSRRFG